MDPKPLDRKRDVPVLIVEGQRIIGTRPDKDAALSYATEVLQGQMKVNNLDKMESRTLHIYKCVDIVQIKVTQSVELVHGKPNDELTGD